MLLHVQREDTWQLRHTPVEKKGDGGDSVFRLSRNFTPWHGRTRPTAAKCHGASEVGTGEGGEAYLLLTTES